MRKKFWGKLKIIAAATAVSMSLVMAPQYSLPVQAATTCSSVVTYPGTTTTAVNVRKQAGTAYQSYGVVPANTSVTILGLCNNNGEDWYKVSTKVNGTACTGYIFASYVKKAASVKGTVDVKEGSYLNMRKSPSTSAESIAKLYKGNQVTLTGMTGGWYAITITENGKTKSGYASAAYIKVGTTTTGSSGSSNSNSNSNSNPSSPITYEIRWGFRNMGLVIGNETAGTPGYVNSNVTTALNVRYAPSVQSAILLTIPTKTKVTVLETKDDWYKITVTYGGKTVTGYVAKQYITLGNPDSGSSTTPTTPPIVNTTEQAAYVNSSVTTYLRVRDAASTSGNVLATIPYKTVVTVLATTGDWYKIRLTYNGKTIVGFAAKQYITIGTLPPENGNNNTEETPDIDNVAFETLLKKFPASYQTQLISLHKTYPKWKFVAVNTNLDWSAAVANESIVGRNVIQSNYPRGTCSLAPFSYLSTASGAYNWATDSYVVKDGYNWYSADSKVIAHYMDPRNFLNSTDIFQFEALAYDSSQKPTVVQSILSNTFMRGNYSVVDSATNTTVTGSYKQAFMDAGVKSKASPYFLATRCKQEVGLNGSNSTSGTYPGYEGIYNFYNIGAFDGTNAVAQGLNWARTGTSYGKPWTNPYKSIVGGAQYIASNYINVGQNTLYLQKFNVHPTDPSKLYTHQYMTNVQAPYSEGRTTRSAYNSLGILNEEMVFYIPVYNNMPSKPCDLPASAGNPNPYLASITVKNNGTSYGLTPTFSKPDTTGFLSNNAYTIVVPKEVSSVVISATAISRFTTISGTGTYTLGASGTTKVITITGKAQNGKTQSYTVQITRK
ncbi:MAG: SH3 domain-containing protein [Lachnospiraceae bacterium]